MIHLWTGFRTGDGPVTGRAKNFSGVGEFGDAMYSDDSGIQNRVKLNETISDKYDVLRGYDQLQNITEWTPDKYGFTEQEAFRLLDPNLQPDVKSEWETVEGGIMNTGGLVSPTFSLDDFIRNLPSSQSFPAAVTTAAGPPGQLPPVVTSGLVAPNTKIINTLVKNLPYRDEERYEPEKDSVEEYESYFG